jgi:hypothetical protein
MFLGDRATGGTAAAGSMMAMVGIVIVVTLVTVMA